MTGISTSLPEPEKDAPTATVSGLVLRLAVLALVDVGLVWLITNMALDGLWPLTVLLGLITIFLNVTFLRQGMYPLRWMAVGLVLMTLITVFPILYTVYISFTNYGDGHLVTKQQAIEQLEKQTFLPETGTSYSWTAFRTPEGEFALWLIDAEGNGFWSAPGEELLSANEVEGLEETDEEGIPARIGDYERVPRARLLTILGELEDIQFGTEEEGVRIRNINEAGNLEQRYIYDEEADTILDRATDTIYRPVRGTFTAEDGSTLAPGFSVGVGPDNFTRFFTSPAIGGPLVRVVIWNFIFPLVTVVTTFFLGLFTAMLFNDLPGRKIIRSLLIIPYTIPSLVTILVWRGMLNEEIGVITRILDNTIGTTPPWFSDPLWAKLGILLVNLWLGYPYFMLVCSGALQGIPDDIYSAADVDGASAWQKFWNLTLPLLLVAVGPLLVASYVFNFTNFNVIFLYNSGGPPIAGAATTVGHTDILISYVFNLAFRGTRGAEYGFASAITIIIFFVVAVVTLFQFRYTNMWEEAT